MTVTDLIATFVSGGYALVRGTVRSIDEDGAVLVQLDSRAPEAPPEEHVTLRCEVLKNSRDSEILAAPGDAVLIAQPVNTDCGILLGIIGLTAATGGTQGTQGESAPVPTPDGKTPDRIVLRAYREIVLQVGSAKLRITQDGRIILRGENILSHARGTQRIKGGSVAIN